MFINLLLYLIATSSLANTLNTCTVTLEAENGSGGDTVLRSDASGRLAVKLEDGEFISYRVTYITSENVCFIKLLEVTYSIDGLGTDDYFEILLGSTVLGSFRTFGDSSDHGDFLTRRGFSTEKQLLTSQYILLIRALDDGNGAEIDKLSLQLRCTNSLEDGECHPSVISFQNNEQSDNNAYDVNDDIINDDNNNNDDETGVTVGGVLGGIGSSLLICCCICICVGAILGSN